MGHIRKSDISSTGIAAPRCNQRREKRYKLDAAKAAVTALSRHMEVKSDLFREPKNPGDSNAVQVYVWTKFLNGELLGYLPRDQAMILSKYPIEMPIPCEISSIRTDGPQYFVKLIVPVPPK